MNKKLIRLTEQDLHRIVKESVDRILRENEENEGLGKWVRAGIDAASKKQRSNPLLRRYNGNHFGDSFGNWLSRTKQNAQYEDDMNYLNNSSNSRQNIRHMDDFNDAGDYRYQQAKQRAATHRAQLNGRDEHHFAVKDDNGRTRTSSTRNNTNNYNYRNGKWVRDTSHDDEF